MRNGWFSGVFLFPTGMQAWPQGASRKWSCHTVHGGGNCGSQWLKELSRVTQSEAKGELVLRPPLCAAFTHPARAHIHATLTQARQVGTEGQGASLTRGQGARAVSGSFTLAGGPRVPCLSFKNNYLLFSQKPQYLPRRWGSRSN